MGARSYIPQLGRFLTPDPIPGGSANRYDYANRDPINTFDLGGTCTSGSRHNCSKHNKTGPTGESKHEAHRRSQREVGVAVRSVIRRGSFGITFAHPISAKKEESLLGSLEDTVINAGASAGHWSVSQVESVVSSVGGTITSAAPSCALVGAGLDAVEVGAGVAVIVGTGGTGAVVVGGFAGVAGAGFDVAGKEGAC
jgi:hypothetical protein